MSNDTTTSLGPNPSGLCMCGCGEKTSIAKQTHRKHGLVRGMPVMYIHGHCRRKSPHEYIVNDDGCWVWQRCLDEKGYGNVRVEGRTTRAHRHYYERDRGPIPEGMELDHLCRNRACVNPDHLEPVTHAENSRRGAQTKLTPAEVQAIRARLAQGELLRVLAHEFGVSVPTIGNIKCGDTWRRSLEA